MTDIVKRLRAEGAMAGHYDAPAIQREAAAEIEWLRTMRDRLAGDLAKAHREALAWMEKANQPTDDIQRLRAGLLRCVQYDNKCDQTGAPCREPERCSCHLEAQTWLE